jgi:hypothetical protein
MISVFRTRRKRRSFVDSLLRMTRGEAALLRGREAAALLGMT